ncbi:eukaryotic translation initiation factor 5A-1-like isoform X2 [Pecten maximus]|uniref:eukaryotic translation initiation factor 5A-1-like isoform X2 n=1 Tax=Pecten maximus TaxID=6579 RepID=UPI0014586DC0|nr:eukaryotic translation initiation factor 5A-1-like isoform X2 [Pecten maximus]
MRLSSSSSVRLGSLSEPFVCLVLFGPAEKQLGMYLMKFIVFKMSDHEDINSDFQGTESGAAKFFPQQCSALRKNGHVLIKNRPCKIVEMSTSKTGKHGHAKVHMVGIDIFTGKKYEDICPSTHNMSVPLVKRTDYQLIDITDDYASLMDDGGEIRSDLIVPKNETGEELRQKFKSDEGVNVTVLNSMDEEVIIGIKPGTK